MTNNILRSSLLFLTVYSPNVLPSSIDFSGQLEVVLEDTGSAVYSGSAIGSTFSGTIDDVTKTGQISDGTTATTFACCALVAEESPDISNNTQLSADEADLLNSLAGSADFSAGDLVDSVNLEGDAMTSTGGRIEIGLSYILNAAAFDDEQIENYPFDPGDTLLTLFFILEEDASGADIFDAIGTVTIVDSTTPATGAGQTSIPGQLLARDLDGDPGNVEAYFDPALGITWLRDTNLAISETFEVPDIGTDGGMNLTTAQLWINTMNSASYLGHTGWRMPTLSPVAGGNVYNNSYTNNALTDVGGAKSGVGWVDAAGKSASEFGHLFYVTLGNSGRIIPDGDGSPISQIVQPDWGTPDPGPFMNIATDLIGNSSYWNGLFDVNTVFNAPAGWFFYFAFGGQSVGSDSVFRLTWPVHDGDIGTPLTDDSVDVSVLPGNVVPVVPNDAIQDAGTDISATADADQNARSGSGGGALNLWLLMIGFGYVFYRELSPCRSAPHSAPHGETSH